MTLGVDIGGTNIVLGLVNDGQIVRSESFKSFDGSSSLKETLSYLSSLIDRFFCADVAGIGVGVPSVVDLDTGTVFDTANIPSWEEVHLGCFLVNKYGVPVQVNNDANCYALGAWRTLSKSYRPGTLVSVTLGTGVGVGIVHNGKLFCGANCGAGELCCYPYKGKSIEDFCSKKFFVSRGVSPRDAYKAAAGGDEEARALFREYGSELGRAIHLILLAYDPDCIVLGGGLSNNYEFFKDSMMEYLRESFPYKKTLEKLRIEIAKDDSIPVIGAASLV